MANDFQPPSCITVSRSTPAITRRLAKVCRKVVQAEIFDLGGADGRRDGLFGPPQIGVALGVGKDQRVGLQRAWTATQYLAHATGHRHVASLAVLATRDGQHTGFEVYVLPREPKEFEI